MTLLSDENLMAYVDNELDIAVRNKLEAELQKNQEAQVRLKQFQKSADALRIFDRVLEEPIPDSIAQIFTSDSNVAENNDNAIPLNNQVEQPFFSKPRLAFAASIIFCAGIAIGLLSNTQTQATGLLQAALPNVLESQKSGEPVTHIWNEEQYEIMVLGTFSNNDNRYCRSFELTHLPDHTRIGLACRATNKQWDVHMLVSPNPVVDSKQVNNNSYQPASSGRELIDAAKRELGVKVTINLNKEQALLKQHWNDGH